MLYPENKAWTLTAHPTPHPTFSKFAYYFVLLSLVLFSSSHYPPPSSVHPSTLWTLATSPVLSVLNFTLLLYWISWFSSWKLSCCLLLHVFCTGLFLDVLPQSTISPAFTSEVLLCLSNLVQRSVTLCLSSPSPQCYLLGQGHHFITFTVLSG